jgi:predicted amidophosphoribosyltransferase
MMGGHARTDSYKPPTAPPAGRAPCCTCCCPRPAPCAAAAAMAWSCALPARMWLQIARKVCGNPMPKPTSFPRRRESKFLASDSTIPACAGTTTCGACLADPPAFDATIAAVDYAAPLDQLVLQLKFSARLALAPWFAQQLRDATLARAAWPCPTCCAPCRWARTPGRTRLQPGAGNRRPLAAALGVALHPALAAAQLDTRAQSGVSPPSARATCAARSPWRIRTWSMGATSASSTTS